MLQMPQGIGLGQRFTSASRYLKPQAAGEYSAKQVTEQRVIE